MKQKICQFVLCISLVTVPVATTGLNKAQKLRADEHKKYSTKELVELLNSPALLPPQEDVKRIEESLPQSLNVLQNGLVNKESNVRRNTAYVMDKLGSKAKPLVPDLRKAFRHEKRVINRIYFAIAFSGIGDSSKETVSLLHKAFEDEKHLKLKTYIAGALVTVIDPTKERQAWQWLMDSLTTGAPEGTSEKDIEQHWDRRWGASKILGRLGARARPALEVMKILRDAPSTPIWVQIRLNDDIPKIKFATERKGGVAQVLEPGRRSRKSCRLGR